MGGKAGDWTGKAEGVEAAQDALFNHRQAREWGERGEPALGHRGREAELQGGRWWGRMDSGSESERVLSFRAWQLPPTDPAYPCRPLALSLAVWAMGSTEGLVRMGGSSGWPVSAGACVVQMAAGASQAPSANLGFQAPPQGALASTSEQPHFSLGRRWAGPVGGEEVGGRSHRDAGWRLQPSPGGGGRRAPPGTALSFPAGNKRLCVSSLRRAGLQIEIIKSLWFSNQCEVINVLAWSVINPGAAAQAQDNGGFFFGSVIFFFFFTGR